MREKVIDLILQHKVIAIARGITPEQCLQAAQALYDGGIRLMEVTFDQKDPQKQAQTLLAIESLCRHFGDTMAIGAGTVTTVALAEKAAKAGAKYVISPDCQEDVIRRTRELGLVSIPGCLTPTEITSAYRWGADFVKLFPAGELGIGYIKAVKAPLNHIPVLAFGGVDGENITEYLEAGCCGAGIGGNLVNKKWIEAGQYDKLTATAAALTQKLARYK